MTLDSLFDPNFKLLLALEIDASIEVLGGGGLVFRTIHVPFHSDEIAFGALKLINV